MNLFSNLFGKKLNGRNSTPENDKQTGIYLDLSIPPEDLFIDKEVPRQDPDPVQQKRSLVAGFLERDFFGLGYRDGYEYHNKETFDAGKKRVRADFLLIVDKMLDQKYAERLKVENIITDVMEISDDTVTKLVNTLRDIDRAIDDLKKQKELSVDSAGWISSAIYGYEKGFVQGTDIFLQEEDLLKPNINL